MPPPLGCAKDTQSGLLASAGCVCVCVCVCGSVEHYGLLSVSKLKRSPTLASFNVAQAAGMELQSPSSLPFSTGLYCIALHCTHHMQ